MPTFDRVYTTYQTVKDGVPQGVKKFWGTTIDAEWNIITDENGVETGLETTVDIRTDRRNAPQVADQFLDPAPDITPVAVARLFTVVGSGLTDVRGEAIVNLFRHLSLTGDAAAEVESLRQALGTL